MANRQRRPTREETRARLIDASARVFARRGFHGASLEQIASEAGFTRGAVYSNFADKDSIFMALLESRFARRLREVEDAIEARDNVVDRTTQVADQFVVVLEQERDWSLLLMEFWSYAVRNPRLRRRFARYESDLRTAFAGILLEQAAELGINLPLPAEELATAFMAMAHGVAIERLSNPKAVPPHLFPFMLNAFVAGAAGAAAVDADASLATGSPGRHARAKR